MKDTSDVVRGWLRKADSDLVALAATLNAGSLDAACFHAQQAAEKYLKAYLTHAGAEFPYTHNLAKLVELCAAVDASFDSLVLAAEPLTPFATESRYDSEFWPDEEMALEARAAAQHIRDFVLTRLPDGLSRPN